MGLFGKLFEKKECAICGGEIGLLGNRKLEDGNMCKECARKLSPWFDERRHSTVEQIKAQLQYREANRMAVMNFRTTRNYGEDWELKIDETQGKFMIQRTRNADEENPDVVDLSQITGVELDIDEMRTEDKRTDKDGNKVSYNPPRYDYQYDFNIIIRVRHPYFDDMKLQLNNDSVRVENVTIRPGSPRNGHVGRSNIAYQRYEAMGQEIKAVLLRQNMPGTYQQGYVQQPMYQQQGSFPQQQPMYQQQGSFPQQQPMYQQQGSFPQQQPMYQQQGSFPQQQQPMYQQQGSFPQQQQPMYQQQGSFSQQQPMYQQQGSFPQQQPMYQQQGAAQTGFAAAVAATAPRECPACGAPVGNGKFCESCGTPLK